MNCLHNSRTTLKRCAAAILLVGITGLAQAQVEKPSLKMSLGWLFQATQAQFVVAAEMGYFKKEGLEVAVDRGAGSATSIQRVISGAYDISYADVGTIVKWNLESPGRELVVFYVVEDGFPLASISLKKSGITKPKDLEGKKIGAPTFDGGRQMFPVFAKANGIDQSKVTWQTMDANLREQTLVRGDVDAITGFVTSAIPTLGSLGVKASDLTVLRYGAFNTDGFGNAAFTTREFAEKNPKTLSAFTRGLNRAMKDMVNQPRIVIDALRVRDPLVNADVERERLKILNTELVLTKNTRDNGFSSVDMRRLDAQIASVADAFGLKNSITAASLYTNKFLPPKAERMPPAEVN
jgi:NitT/TauT family transport system substrate-binding protein